MIYFWSFLGILCVVGIAGIFGYAIWWVVGKIREANAPPTTCGCPSCIEEDDEEDIGKDMRHFSCN